MIIKSVDVPNQLFYQLDQEFARCSLHIISNHKLAHIASGPAGDLEVEAIRD